MSGQASVLMSTFLTSVPSVLSVQKSSMVPLEIWFGVMLNGPKVPVQVMLSSVSADAAVRVMEQPLPTRSGMPKLKFFPVP